MSSASGSVDPRSNPDKGDNLFWLKRNNFKFEFNHKDFKCKKFIITLLITISYIDRVSYFSSIPKNMF